MALNPDLRIKIRHFFKDHYKVILIVMVVAIVLILINRFLIERRYSGTPPTTYQPNVAILDSKESTVPKKVAKGFEDFIKDYVGYCNNRNYVAAWNLISEDCKENFFGNSYNMYVEYVRQKFDGSTKRYAIQNYSNVDGKYIYNVRIFEDFLATGVTNQKYGFQEEKIIVSYDENKNIVFSVGNYMGAKKLNYMASNDYLRVEVTEVIEKYNFSIYTLKFLNRTNNTIVIKDGLSGGWEVGLVVGNESRSTLDETSIVLGPGESTTTKLSFEKFYDSASTAKGIVLNAVRVMENYTGNPETAEAEIENAINKFSMTISF